MSFASDGDEDCDSGDLEAPQTAASINNDSGMFENRGSRSASRGSASAFRRGKKSSNAFDLGFLADRFGDGRKKVGLGWFSSNKNRTNDRFEAAISRGSMGTRSMSLSRTIAAKLCPGMDAERRRKEEFIAGKCRKGIRVCKRFTQISKPQLIATQLHRDAASFNPTPPLVSTRN